MDFVPTDKFKVTTALWPAGQPVPTIAGPKPGQPGVPLAYTEFVTFHEKGLDFDYVVAGRTDGAISRWKVQQVAAGRRREHKEDLMQTSRPHVGAVKTMLYSSTPAFCVGYNGHGLLFTGSADRTIKVWNVWAEKQEPETCVQTLVGHGATVTAILERAGGIVSCSTDRTVRVWRAGSGRELFTKVFFACAQTLSLWPSPGPFAEAWASTMALSRGQAATLFVGDAKGNIVLFGTPGVGGGGGGGTVGSPSNGGLRSPLATKRQQSQLSSRASLLTSADNNNSNNGFGDAQSVATPGGSTTLGQGTALSTTMGGGNAGGGLLERRAAW